MTARLLGFDPASGLAQWWLEDGEGNWAQKASQRVEALLDLNREARNHCDPYNTARDVRMVARIPLIIIAKWRHELGVDYWNPDHQDKVDALLNDADWRWLRTDGGMLRALTAGSAALGAAHELCDPQGRATEWRAPGRALDGRANLLLRRP